MLNFECMDQFYFEDVSVNCNLISTSRYNKFLHYITKFVTRSDIQLTYQLDSIDSLKAYLGDEIPWQAWNDINLS